MQITCFGASQCVTGSCFLVDNGKKYLIDCGLFQGARHLEAMNRQEWGFNPARVEALFLTHAHIDHSGRIPKLVRDGFRGKIYASQPTVELSRIMLLDSAHIQEMQAEWENRKNRRSGRKEVQPLYTVEDANACFQLFEPVSQDSKIRVDEGLEVRFRNAGHILGSSILELWAGNGATPHKVVFSGDIGKKDQLIVKDPHSIFMADTLFIESTYGNRNHKPFEESKKELLEAIHYSHQHREKVIIPAFAVERTQEILYIIGEFFREGLIPDMPVYLDSPLAIAATEIFRKMRSYYDEDAAAIVAGGEDPFHFPQLVLTRSAAESMAINEARGPAIVVAGNGMCTAGRIMHHLKHNIWRQGASLVIVGFQAEGTLGRRIVDGAQTVKIFGEPYTVKARLFTIGGFSAHADQSDLLEWLGKFENPLLRVFAIHGEPGVSKGFARLVHETFGFIAEAPAIGDIIPLTPFRREALKEEMEELKWQRQLMRLVQKAEEVRSLWESSPQAFTTKILKQLEDEMARTEKQLEQVLQQARKRR